MDQWLWMPSSTEGTGSWTGLVLIAFVGVFGSLPVFALREIFKHCLVAGDWFEPGDIVSQADVLGKTLLADDLPC